MNVEGLNNSEKDIEKNPFSLYEERLEKIKDSLELEDLKIRLELETRLFVLKEEYYEKKLNASDTLENNLKLKQKISKLKKDYNNNSCKIRYLIATRIAYMSDIELDKYRKDNRYDWKIDNFLGETIYESEKKYSEFFNSPISDVSSRLRFELLTKVGIKGYNLTTLNSEVLDYFLHDIKKYIFKGEEELVRKIGGSNIHQIIIDNSGLIDQLQTEFNNSITDDISFSKREEFIRRLEGILGKEDAITVIDFFINARNNITINIPFSERISFLSEQVKVLDEIYSESDRVKKYCKEKEKLLIEEKLNSISDDSLTTEEIVLPYEKK